MHSFLKSLVWVFSHPLNRKNYYSTAFRLVAWKMNQITLRLPTIINIVPSRKCICYPDSSFAGQIVYSRLPDYEEMTYLLDHLKSDDCFIDVGANIGVYSLLASSVIRKGKIIAFEPFPDSAARFKENMNINRLSNVSLVEKAVSDKTGWERLGVEAESEVNHIAYDGKKSKEIRVRSISLDDYVMKKQIKKIDVLKVDVEGAESKVIEGARKSIEQKRIHTILIELNRNSRFFGSSNRSIVRILMDSGYRVYRLDNGKLIKFKSPREINNDSIINVLAVLESDC